MASIRIKNIGPIRDTGVITLTHIMLVIGEQSTGKSTFLKILCYCRWVEKRVMIGENINVFNYNGDFVKKMMEFHQLSSDYFSEKSEVEYNGEAVTIRCDGKKGCVAITSEFEKVRHNTKLSYIPAERNLLSVIPQIDDKYRSSTFNAMFNSVIEFNEANHIFSREKPLRLSFDGNMEYFHEGANDYVRLLDRNDMQPLPLEFTSSGVKAALPLNVIVHYLCQVTGSPSKRTPQMVISDRSLGFEDDVKQNRTNAYNYPQLFIEEPEQHLYPLSQARLVRDIIAQFSYALKKTGKPGYVFVTTHSPYILSQLNVLLKARQASQKNKLATLNVVPEECILPLSYYSAYFMSKDGTMENMIDRQTRLIMGEYLDSVSEEVEEALNRLNDIIFAQDEQD